MVSVREYYCMRFLLSLWPFGSRDDRFRIVRSLSGSEEQLISKLWKILLMHRWFSIQAVHPFSSQIRLVKVIIL